ncbi:MAG: hypothetical protein BM564_01050 [Bacteroidetes bacterium MedPE-SWsnd-G2]|nr:MAG: hypothetical protein BM564_01050 [Bacteroidetes bacterium MedPE-SWsnd-G2]
MTYIFKIITRFWYFNLPQPILYYGLTNFNSEVLEILSKKGHFKTRLFISEHLHILNPFQQISISNLLLQDPIERISQNAIRFINSTQLDALTAISTNKAMFWEAKRLKQIQIKKEALKFDRRGKSFKRKFGDGESFKLVKKSLNKPIR